MGQAPILQHSILSACLAYEIFRSLQSEFFGDLLEEEACL